MYIYLRNTPCYICKTYCHAMYTMTHTNTLNYYIDCIRKRNTMQYQL